MLALFPSPDVRPSLLAEPSPVTAGAKECVCVAASSRGRSKDQHLIRQHSPLAQNTFFPTWDAVQNVIAPGADRQRPVPNVHPPFAEWIVMNADPERTRTLVEYGVAEQAAMTVHFRSDNEVRLFGTPGFIYYPTIEWQVCTIVANIMESGTATPCVHVCTGV